MITRQRTKRYQRLRVTLRGVHTIRLIIPHLG